MSARLLRIKVAKQKLVDFQNEINAEIDQARDFMTDIKALRAEGLLDADQLEEAVVENNAIIDELQRELDELYRAWR